MVQQDVELVEEEKNNWKQDLVDCRQGVVFLTNNNNLSLSKVILRIMKVF